MKDKKPVKWDFSTAYKADSQLFCAMSGKSFGRKERRRLHTVVIPAGSGKTTVVQTLRQYREQGKIRYMFVDLDVFALEHVDGVMQLADDINRDIKLFPRLFTAIHNMLIQFDDTVMVLVTSNPRFVNFLKIKPKRNSTYVPSNAFFQQLLEASTQKIIRNTPSISVASSGSSNGNNSNNNKPEFAKQMSAPNLLASRSDVRGSDLRRTATESAHLRGSSSEQAQQPTRSSSSLGNSGRQLTLNIDLDSGSTQVTPLDRDQMEQDISNEIDALRRSRQAVLASFPSAISYDSMSTLLALISTRFNLSSVQAQTF